jgi:hypothetical protein
MNGQKITREVLSVSEWRNRFKAALNKFPKGKVLYQELGSINSYYLSLEGKQTLDNVKYGKASITKTVEAVDIIEKWLNLRKESKLRNKILKTQKLHVQS